VSKKIDLPFTVESVKKVLAWGASPDDSPFTHQDIAHWCDQFHIAIFNTDTTDKMVNIATDIANDVDAQWEMFLANTYTLKELQKLDFSKVTLPVDWFNDWLNKIK